MRLQDLARYWATRYASSYEEDTDVPHAVIAVGAHADVICSDDTGDFSPARAGHLIGMITYPADAVHIVACRIGLAIDDHDQTYPSVICWAHTIPTRESEAAIGIRHVEDDGSVRWDVVRDYLHAEDPVFLAYVEGAHAFDGHRIADNEWEGRTEALKMIHQHNGEGYIATIAEPGTIAAEVEEFLADE